MEKRTHKLYVDRGPKQDGDDSFVHQPEGPACLEPAAGRSAERPIGRRNTKPRIRLRATARPRLIARSHALREAPLLAAAAGEKGRFSVSGERTGRS